MCQVVYSTKSAGMFRSSELCSKSNKKNLRLNKHQRLCGVGEVRALLRRGHKDFSHTCHTSVLLFVLPPPILAVMSFLIWVVGIGVGILFLLFFYSSEMPSTFCEGQDTAWVLMCPCKLLFLTQPAEQVARSLSESSYSQLCR